MSKLPPPPPTPPPPPPSNVPPMLPPPPPPLPKSEPPMLEKQSSIRNGNQQQSSYQTTPKMTNTITETIEKFDQLLKSANSNNTNFSKSNGNNNNAQILTTPVSQAINSTKIKNSNMSAPTTSVPPPPSIKQFVTTTLNDLTNNEHYTSESSNQNARNQLFRPQSEQISYIPEEITPIIITGAPEITKTLINPANSNGSTIPRATSLLINEQPYISSSKTNKSSFLNEFNLIRIKHLNIFQLF